MADILSEGTNSKSGKSFILGLHEVLMRDKAERQRNSDTYSRIVLALSVIIRAPVTCPDYSGLVRPRVNLRAGKVTQEYRQCRKLTTGFFRLTVLLRHLRDADCRPAFLVPQGRRHDESSMGCFWRLFGSSPIGARGPSCLTRPMFHVCTTQMDNRAVSMMQYQPADCESSRSRKREL
jgi:hypothetical protein